MKKTFEILMARHAKAEGLDGTVLQAELERAFLLGQSLSHLSCAVVSHTALIRSATSAAQIAAGMNCPHRFAEAVPELGCHKLVAEITAPEGYREREKQIGCFAAMLEMHGPDRSREFANRFMDALDRHVVQKAQDGERWLFVGHSPVLELLFWAMAEFITSNAQRPELAAMDYLDVVHMRIKVADDGSWEAWFVQKFSTPRE